MSGQRSPSNSVESILNSGVNAMFREMILPSICSFLSSEKNVEVTVDELADCIGVNMTAPASTPRMVSLPGFSMNGTSAAAASARKTTRASANDPNKKTCQWILRKGDHEGEPCGKTSAKGEDGEYADYCRQHLTSIEKQAAGGGRTTRPKASAKMSNPTMPGAVPQAHPPPKKNEKMTANRYITPEGELGVFLVSGNFIIVTDPVTRDKMCTGICEPTGEVTDVTIDGKTVQVKVGNVREATPDEVQVAKSLGLKFVQEVEDQNGSASAQAPPRPQIQASAAVQGVPSIPRSAQIPRPAGIPPLPNIGAPPSVIQPSMVQTTTPQASIPRPSLPLAQQVISEDS